GDDAQLDLGLPELGVVGGVTEVGGEGELTPPAEAEAVDGGDGDLRDVLDERKGLLETADPPLHLARRGLRHLLDVRSGSEDLLPSPDDPRPNVLPDRGLGGHFHEVTCEVVVDRVHGRTVQSDRADAVLDLESNELTHGRTSSGVARML